MRELDDLGTLEAEFTYIPQPYAHLVSQNRDNASIFHHFDGVRDTRQLTDSAGVVTDEYTHDAWGELKSSTGATSNAHTFKGQLLAYRNDPDAGPEASIYSLHYRDYIASQGRLRSEDPARDDINPYRYVGNDPVNRVDPSGLADRRLTGDENLRYIDGLLLPVWLEKQNYVGLLDRRDRLKNQIAQMVDEGMAVAGPEGAT